MLSHTHTTRELLFQCSMMANKVCIEVMVRGDHIIQLAQIISLTIIGKTALQSCHGNSRAFDGSECRCLFSGQDLQGYG